ncbi:MAG: penicillin-binding protein activator [Deltaproteobacteria bacterium]|nr:penicillin-binding protein activator [Deltaproteobacteria bacterium]
MKAQQIMYLDKVIAIGMMTAAFFIVSCEKRVVLKEPPPTKPVVVKAPEERPAEEELQEKKALEAKPPEELPPVAVPPEEIAREEIPPERPPVVEAPKERPAEEELKAEEEPVEVVPEEIAKKEKPPEELPPVAVPHEEIAREEIPPEELPPVAVPHEEIAREEIPPEELWPERKVLVDQFFIAEHYFRQQEYDLALEAYEQYLLEYPLGDKVKDALAQMGTIYYYKNRYGESLSLLKEALKAFPLNNRRAEIHLLIAEIYYHTGKHQESKQTALRWLELYRDYPDKAAVYDLLGQNTWELNEFPRAFYWWLKVHESPSIAEERRQAVRSHLTDLISKATEEQLEEMATYAKGSDLMVPLYVRLGTFFLNSDRLDEAREAAMEILRLATEEGWIRKGRKLLDEIDERLMVNLNVIGCLLPLSGPFAVYGQEVLYGLELGLGLLHGGSGDPSSVELVVRDTEGDPQRAVEALRELREDEKAIIVIGPLISMVAEAVVDHAQESGIPIITLSQSEGITRRGEMIFQNSLAPEDQIRSLVNKVIDEMGLSRFAILYPANPYGTYFMNLFWDEVEAKGGVINAAESYDTQSTDFTVEIKKTVGLFYPRPSPELEEETGQSELMNPNGKGEDSEEEPEPIIDFDAIFIPDNHQGAALIASQLAYHDVVDVRLLGTNLWNSPELVEIAGRYVHGAIFPSAFFPGSGYPGVEEFVEQYERSFGQKPGLLAAIGFDTIRIIQGILKEGAEQIKTRSDLSAALAKSDTFESVTGPMSFDEKRRAKRNPLLLTVSNGHFLPMP